MPPEPELQAIVYVSASVPPMTSALLEGLLLEARRLNAESGVTGALIYSDGTFMQYFEGTPEAMSPTYDRIRRSRLHSRLMEMMADAETRPRLIALSAKSPTELAEFGRLPADVLPLHKPLERAVFTAALTRA